MSGGETGEPGGDASPPLPERFPTRNAITASRAPRAIPAMLQGSPARQPAAWAAAPGAPHHTHDSSYGAECNYLWRILHSLTSRGVAMGKGDLRTKRGKIHRGTYGNTRLRKKKRTAPEGRDKQDGYTAPPAPRP